MILQAKVDEKVNAVQHRRNIRACTRCNIGSYQPQDQDYEHSRAIRAEMEQVICFLLAENFILLRGQKYIFSR